MKRVVVVHKCGAIAELLSPEGDEAALERKRQETEARDCPHCEGERRREGAALDVGDGVFGLWRWHELAQQEARRGEHDQADEHFPLGADQGAPRLLPGEEP